MVKVLALDFDGVVCDSINECMVTSYRAYRALVPAGTSPPMVTEMLRREFHARRGYVRPSGHYHLLWKWITEFPERQLSAQEFEALEAEDTVAVKAFEREFHEMRDAFRETAHAEWLVLNPLYPGVKDNWMLLRALPVYIVTTKDRPSVDAILSAHSLAINGIFCRGEMTKPEALRAIYRQHEVAPADVVFVDDNSLHLADAQATGVTACLARWGYGPNNQFEGPVINQFTDLPAFLQSLAS